MIINDAFKIVRINQDGIPSDGERVARIQETASWKQRWDHEAGYRTIRMLSVDHLRTRVTT